MNAAFLLSLRRQRHAARLYRLGARPVFEFVDEIARHHPEIAADIDARLERFTGVDAELLARLGGDRLGQRPLWGIDR